MKSNTTPPSPFDPFSSFEKKNPFVDAMPAQSSIFAASPPVVEETWGPYTHIETIDDGEERFGEERALEILITWGQTVLHVAHLHPPRPFIIGDETDRSGEKVDFHLPEDVLGRKRLPLILIEDGVPQLIVPDIATGKIQTEKQEHDLTATLEGAPLCATVTRAKQMVIADKTRTTVELGKFQVLVRLVSPSAPVEKGLLANFDWAVPSYFAMTSATLGGVMAALAYFVPPIGLEDESAIDKERLLAISHYLDAASEREEKREEVEREQTGGEESGQSAEKAPAEAGAAGKEESKQEHRRVAVKGPADNQQMQLARPEAIQLAREFGMIGILNAGIAADPNAPTSIFGGDVTLGNNDLSANGNLWADDIGEAIGNGALSLYGQGPGGGYGNGAGIGLSDIAGGMLGPGRGKEGWGRGAALQSGTHVAKSPGVIRTPTAEVNGRIPPQVVQRIVRQNFGRFRLCYQQGLARNPSLEGRIPCASSLAATAAFRTSRRWAASRTPRCKAASKAPFTASPSHSRRAESSR